VLRQQRLLDFLLQRHLDRAIEKLDAEVLLALRIGLYQMRYLERIPAHAAVSESVELVKGARKRSAAPLVNAVLRRIPAEARASKAGLESLLADAPAAERLGIVYSHPTWLVQRWLARFGTERTVALLEANNCPPRLCCAVMDPETVEQAAESLRSDGFQVEAGRWLRTALAMSKGNPATAKALREGQVSIQDEASQMVAHLVEARPGETVLDLCAAPGGKTSILARAVAPGGKVIAADVHEHRLRSARKLTARRGIESVRWVALDATQPLPLACSFARILLDAPCSGTGTLARNPEIKWRLRPEDLARAQERQRAMLVQALAKLAPGGRLVYATCSLEPEENEDVVRQAISRDASMRIARCPTALAPRLHEGVSAEGLFDGEGFFRTFPPESGTDGFFAAVVERSG
jgi:16S rRNA (cytosine967-C5)-methyltransferase